MGTDQQTVWETALAEIELDISKANFGTWFKNTHIVKQEEGIVFLGVPNAFVRDWLGGKYHKFILKSLRHLLPDVRALEYTIIPSEAAAETALSPTGLPGQLELHELYTNREDNLNPKYIFETFVVGPFNELGHAAAQAVVQKTGLVYNPLFIYGGTGLGKTHLIQAIGNSIKKNHPAKKVYYVTSEQFVIDYVTSVQNNKVNAFKEKYRKYDVLMMDDVQFLSNKDRTQEELFHLFNHFYENNKQIVFSSDKPPQYIDNLEERLKSRFEGGMMADIKKPDYESRLAILRAKLTGAALAPENEVVEYLAAMIQENIRELEGALNSIICQGQLKNRPLPLAEVKLLVKNMIKPKKTISIKNVAEVVADFYQINEKFLYEKTRKKEVVKPRQVIMYILREDFNISYPYIGQKLGGRDHTTVIHAYEKIKKDSGHDTTLSQELEQIRIRLYNEQ